MKRVAEIKAKREAQFYKNRQVQSLSRTHPRRVPHHAFPLNQDSDGTRKEQEVTARAESRHCEAGRGFCAIYRPLTTHRINFTGEGEGQSACYRIQKEDCSYTRRGAIYGDGRRLDVRSPALPHVSLRFAPPALPRYFSIAILYSVSRSLMVMNFYQPKRIVR